jgi:hypothetical protein
MELVDRFFEALEAKARYTYGRPSQIVKRAEPSKSIGDKK